MPKLLKPTVYQDRLTTPRGSIRVESSEWFSWLAAKPNTSFIFEGRTGRYNARREERRGSAYWYAYRRPSHKLTKAYLGKSEELSSSRLEEIGSQMAGENLLKRLAAEASPAPGLRITQVPELSY